MTDLLRDSLFGHVVSLLSRGKYLARNDAFDTPPPPPPMQAPKVIESETSSSIIGSQLDPEKGPDTKLVEWAKDDPHNPRNWSTPKKFFVTFEVCFLTTSVYIGKCLPRPAQGLSEAALADPYPFDRLCNLYCRHSGRYADFWRQ